MIHKMVGNLGGPNPSPPEINKSLLVRGLEEFPNIFEESIAKLAMEDIIGTSGNTTPMTTHVM